MRKSERIKELLNHIQENGSDMDNIDSFIQKRLRENDLFWVLVIFIYTIIILSVS